MGEAKAKKEAQAEQVRALTSKEKEQLRLATQLFGTMNELLARKELDFETLMRLGRVEEGRDLFLWSQEGRDSQRKWVGRIMLSFSFAPAPKIMRAGK